MRLTIAGQRRPPNPSFNGSDEKPDVESPVFLPYEPTEATRPRGPRPSELIAGPRRLQSSVMDRTEGMPATPVNSGSSWRPPPDSRRSAESQGEHFADVALPSSLEQMYSFRAKRSLWPRVAVAVASLLAIAGLVMLVIAIGGRQTGVNENTAAAANGPRIPERDEGHEDGTAIANTPSSAAGMAEDEKEVTPIEDPPRFFTPDRHATLWAPQAAHLVRLQITIGDTTREATGLIVDSRGWVATSFSAIENANAVMVSGAARRLNDPELWQDGGDMARGVIATNPRRDLALLAINRTLVTSMSEPILDASDSLLSPERLVIARTPPPGFASWLTEAQISGRSDGADNPELQRMLRDEQLELGKDERWVLCDLQQPDGFREQCAGGVLINQQGQIAGMLTTCADNAEAVAVPAKFIEQLVASVGDTPLIQPFAPAPTTANSGSGNPPVSGSGDSDQARALQSRFDRLFKACRGTDWSADNLEEFHQFQDLAQTIEEILSVIQQPRHPSASVMGAWWSEASETLRRSLMDDVVTDELNTGKTNQGFLSEVTSERPWCFLAVTVHRNAIQTPPVQGQDAVTVKLNGTSRDLRVPVGDNVGRFQLGQQFLVFGKIDFSQRQRATSVTAPESNAVLNIFSGFALSLR